MKAAKRKALSLINSVLSPIELQLGKKTEAAEFSSAQAYNESRLPDDAVAYLQPTNSRLKELKQRYVGHPATQHSQWAEELLKRDLKLPFFRGDNAYVYQVRRTNELAYLLTAYYVQTADKMNLWDILDEDNLFGNYVVNFNDERLISRDLLDSILEINFLERLLSLSTRREFNVLDIGAGYGRLAHRLVKSFPNIGRVFCTDAVPESTFLSEYYLKYREVNDKAVVIPLDEIEAGLANNRIDLAINIHSFTECTLDSINWWLDLIRKHEIRHFMIVPTNDKFLSVEINQPRRDFFDQIITRGYKVVAKLPKYEGASSVQKYGIYPAYYYLFELVS